MPKRSKSDDKNAKKQKTGHWSLGLVQAMHDPELFVQSDDLVSVIRDKYPKAQYHYLIVSKKDISNLGKVDKDDLNLLKHMDKVARRLIREERHEKSNFKIGYHSEPSMSRLHLHVISDDMDSPCLKTKKHWNSFNTNFFVASEKIIEDLEKNGRIILPSDERCKDYLETALKCHKCDFRPKTMPDLKKHVLTHSS